MATEKQCAVVLEMFESCFERVYGFVRKFADPETSEEVTQEVFCRLLSLQDFESKEISVSYLIKIADNLLKRRYRRQDRWKKISEQLTREYSQVTRAKAAHDSSNEIDPSRMSDAMDRLSGDEREAVRLIVCEGLSYEDAARSLGVEVSTINNWKHRGIQKLKHHVGTDRGERAAGSARDPRGRPRQRAMPEGSSRRDAGYEAND